MGSTPSLQLQSGSSAPGFAQGSQGGRSNGSVQGEADKQEIERLKSCCQLHQAYQPEWNLYLAAYEGGPDIANERQMFKHQRENDEDFLDRVRRVHYINYCDVLVDFFTQFIFAETIQRSAGAANQDFYDTFRKDVDRKGNSIDDYMKQVSDDIQIYGMSYTLVDTPKAPDAEVVTKQMEQEQGIRPYWVLIHPDEITDWIVDDFDCFSYVKRKQMVERMSSVKTKTMIERYTEWFTDRIEVSEIDVTDTLNPVLLGIVEKFTNALGIIPLKVVRYKRSKRWPHMGNSFIRDFAYNNREIMNITSLIQEFLYRQCFNQLTKETETSIPSASQEDGLLGSSNVIEYPRGAKAPSYLSPPSEPAKFLQEERARIQQEMFRRAAQDTLNELFNGGGASGFSQAQSFSKTVPFIAGRADILEKAEASLMDMTLRYMSKTWDGKIKYKDRYELTNLTDAISQLVMLGRDLMLPSKTFVIEELKRLVQEFDGKITPEMLIIIEKEIDGINFVEWQDVQKQALIGQPKPDGSSPAAKGKSKSKGTSKEAEGKSTQK